MKNESNKLETDAPASEWSDLLACPFCGCNNIEIIMIYHPRCSNCGATQEKILGKDAVKSWNSRETKKRASFVHKESCSAAQDVKNGFDHISDCDCGAQ